MRYHNIITDDMLNGPGLRTVLFVSGCDHHCKGCQNPITWNPESGLIFDSCAFEELMNNLNKEYIRGVTLSGGDPLHIKNVKDISDLCYSIRGRFGNKKSIWLYTGYTREQILNNPEIWGDKYVYVQKIYNLIDGLVDGEFVEKDMDISVEWRGSINQQLYISELPYVKNNPGVFL